MRKRADHRPPERAGTTGRRYTQEAMAITVRAHVINGRLVADVPTDLPEGTEVEFVVRKVVEVNKALTVGDLAGDLIGSVEGPSDLSTSPRHMRGFGRK